MMYINPFRHIVTILEKYGNDIPPKEVVLEEIQELIQEENEENESVGSD